MSSPRNPADVEPIDAVLSVGELNRRVSRLLERSIPLVWVAGEISNFVKAASGHWYFSLKDAQAQVRCVMFRNANRLVDWRMRDGEQIEVRAVAGLYAPRGDFQLTVESMRRAGAGALYEAFLRIKAKLEAEGLFDPARKLLLPAFPKSIGIVTSLQAAALRDVLITLARRAPHVRVVIYPSPVQGKEAPARLVAAIDEAADRARRLHEIDVLLVVRGGGSIEDLWAFNDEAVARALARVSIPLVSGIGHETDVTIADYIAHVRAATPTAAAELASPDAPGILSVLTQHALRNRRNLMRRMDHAEQRLDEISRRLQSPSQRLALRQQGLAQIARRLSQAAATMALTRSHRLEQLAARLHHQRPQIEVASAHLRHVHERLRGLTQKNLAARLARLDLLASRLTLLNPEGALSRGYAIVEDGQGNVVSDAVALSPGDLVQMRFSKGRAKARVESIDAEKSS